MVIYDEHDINSLALCAWKEARGEGEYGCKAVMQVIFNRVGFPGFAHNLHDVVYGKNQFTSMSVPSDPEFNLQPQNTDVVWQQCVDMAVSLLANQDGPQVDITNGAHYYANLHYVSSGWFYENIVKNSTLHPVTAQIGKHTFFK